MQALKKGQKGCQAINIPLCAFKQAVKRDVPDLNVPVRRILSKRKLLFEQEASCRLSVARQ